MKRITKDCIAYRSELLHKLQQYENTGFQPDEIAPKPGSVAEKQRKMGSVKKRKVKLETVIISGGSKASYEIICEGKKMTASQFAETISVQPSTVCKWAREGTFYDRLRERGVI